MSTLDQAEVDRFDALAAEWWAIDGPMAPLHKMNPLRLHYIRDQITRHLQIDSDIRRPFEGLRLLDVGCGCGLLSEPLTRLGAETTAIDPSERNIEVARRHAEGTGLIIDYRPLDTEGLISASVEPFDIVTCLEVIEHSPGGDILAQDLAELTRPGGLLIMSTINRTVESFLKAIVGAEYILGWLPKGTHNWRRFVSPSMLARWLRDAGFRVIDVQGVTYDIAKDDFAFSAERDVNYLITAVRL